MAAIEECNSDSRALPNIIINANRRIGDSFIETSRSGRKSYLDCNDLKLSAKKRFGNQIDGAVISDADIHVPGDVVPNERDIELAIAPRFGMLFPLVGERCNISDRNGCDVRVVTARANIHIDYIRNISCIEEENSYLSCDFIMKLSCESNDPTGIFCTSFSLPYPYYEVKFTREISGWRIVSM